MTAIDATAIEAQALRLGHRTIVLEECGSTNDEARALALQGAAHGTLVVTEQQTAGRGRRGHGWLSCPGRSLTFSLILRPDPELLTGMSLTLATSLAVLQAVEELTGLSLAIKWPNDLLVADRKCSGCLAEVLSGPTGTVVIVGVGLNVNEELADLPEALRCDAISLAIAAGRTFDRTTLLAAILRWLDGVLTLLPSEPGRLQEAVTRHLWRLNGRITVVTETGQDTGLFTGIDGRGFLVLESEGRKRVWPAGEIRRAHWSTPEQGGA